MTTRNKIIVVIIPVIIVLAVLGISQPGLLNDCKTYLDGKPWIKNGERTEYYPDGKPRFKQTRRNGKPDGLLTFWYPSGRKQKEINFSKGEREGKTLGWHENGKKTFEGQFSAGKYNGKWIFYDTNETQVAEIICKNGIFWEGTEARYVDDILQISTYQDGKIVSSEKRRDN